MHPDDFKLYWCLMTLYTRTRYFLLGDGMPRQTTKGFLIWLRLISPEKRCTHCCRKVGWSEVLTNSDNLASERQFAYNGEQLYRSVIHIDCP